MSERSAQLREAYQSLGGGDLDPWMRLLDPRVVWRAIDQPDLPDFDQPKPTTDPILSAALDRLQKKAA